MRVTQLSNQNPKNKTLASWREKCTQKQSITTGKIATAIPYYNMMTNVLKGLQNCSYHLTLHTVCKVN